MDELLRDIALALIAPALALVLAALLSRILSRYGEALARRSATRLDDQLLQALQNPLRLLIVLIGLDIGRRQFRTLDEAVVDLLGNAMFVLYALLAFVVVYRLARLFIAWYGEMVARRTETRADDRFLAVFRYTSGIIIGTIIVIILLDRFEVDITGLVATLGIGSLAIALAAQATLSDVIAGFMLAIDQPFKVGDRIEILDIATWGDVTDIGLRSTRILTRDNRTVSIPNSVIGRGLVVNYSIPSQRYRVETHVGVAYGTDLELARETMIEAIRQEEWVMRDERIEALLLEFGESNLIFRVRCWIEHYVETRRVIDRMNSALYQALSRADIRIAFPQRDVHLLSRPGPGNAATVQ